MYTFHLIAADGVSLTYVVHKHEQLVGLIREFNNKQFYMTAIDTDWLPVPGVPKSFIEIAFTLICGKRKRNS